MGRHRHLQQYMQMSFVVHWQPTANILVFFKAFVSLLLRMMTHQ